LGTGGSNILELKINSAGITFTLASNTTIAAEIYVFDGYLDTDSGNDYSLTSGAGTSIGNVVGATSSAKIIGNSSAIEFLFLVVKSDGEYDATDGTTTINGEDTTFAIDFQTSSVLTANSGTFHLTTGAATHVQELATGNFYDFIMEATSDCWFRPTGLTIDNTFTSNDGTWMGNGSTYDFTVESHVVVNNGGTLSTSGDW